MRAGERFNRLRVCAQQREALGKLSQKIMENAGALTEVEPTNRRWDGDCYRENLTRMRAARGGLWLPDGR